MNLGFRVGRTMPGADELLFNSFQLLRLDAATCEDEAVNYRERRIIAIGSECLSVRGGYVLIEAPTL